MIIFGKIDGGIIKVQRFYWDEVLKNNGKLVTIQIDKNIRSLAQNSYLWGIYKLISEHTGFTPEEVHEVFKKRFLKYTKEFKGKVYEFTGTTTALTTAEFSEYIEKGKDYAQQELQIIIPDPDISFPT